MPHWALPMFQCNGNSQYLLHQKPENSLNQMFFILQVNKEHMFFPLVGKKDHFSMKGTERFLAPDEMVVLVVMVVVVVVPRPKSVLSNLSRRNPGQNDVM